MRTDYYGLHGDKNNLSLPLDILESLARHYDMNVKELYNVYTKGLYHGIAERDIKREISDEKE